MYIPVDPDTTHTMSVLTIHKRARYDYDILDTFEAGISLMGTEVKSLRDHRGKLDGAYVGIRGGEAFLFNMHVPPYQVVNTSTTYDPVRVRKLLLTKRELRTLDDAAQTKGLTIIPLELYTIGRHIKVLFAIARGKKKHDKRETIKKRETERTMRRLLKS